MFSPPLVIIGDYCGLSCAEADVVDPVKRKTGSTKPIRYQERVIFTISWDIIATLESGGAFHD